jgi:hypothetical protein
MAMSYVRLQAMLSDLGFSIQSKSTLPAGVTQTTILRGTGTPEAVVTAPPATIYLRSDGGASTMLYIKSTGTGNTGWAAMTVP